MIQCSHWLCFLGMKIMSLALRMSSCCYVSEGETTKHNSWVELIVRVSLFCLKWETISGVGGTVSWSRSVGRKLFLVICSQSYCQESIKTIQANLVPAVWGHWENSPRVYLLNEHRKVDGLAACLFWVSRQQQSWTCCTLCRQEGFLLENTGICTNLFISLECTLSFLT